MPYQLALADVLRRWGLPVLEVDGWKTRGRERFDPCGTIAHHTGPGRPAALLRLCIEGRSDLDGPLCNVFLDPAGVCHIVAAGAANHAGAGSWRGVSGNRRFWGIEAAHPGDKTPWPAAQLTVYPRLCAALQSMNGDGALMVCGHREYAPKRKIDPAGIDMTKFRGAVAAHLAGGPAPTPDRKVTPMHDPPIVVAPVVAELVPEDGRGVWLLHTDGGVSNWGGAPFFGSPHGKPYFAAQFPARLIPGDSAEVPERDRVPGTYAVVTADASVYGPRFG